MEAKILLVEDEIKTGELLVKALETKGIDVDWYVNGADALAKFDSGKYDLIVLDLKLPGMTGDEILEKIREIDKYVATIIYSNYEEIPVMKKLINLGVDKYIHKGPEANLWETVETIEKLLNPMSEDEAEDVLKRLPSDVFDRKR
jgi:DNA-binding response OmpR family regulator